MFSFLPQFEQNDQSDCMCVFLLVPFRDTDVKSSKCFYFREWRFQYKWEVITHGCVFVDGAEVSSNKLDINASVIYWTGKKTLVKILNLFCCNRSYTFTWTMNILKQWTHFSYFLAYVGTLVYTEHASIAFAISKSLSSFLFFKIFWVLPVAQRISKLL